MVPKMFIFRHWESRPFYPPVGSVSIWVQKSRKALMKTLYYRSKVHAYGYLKTIGSNLTLLPCMLPI